MEIAVGIEGAEALSKQFQPAPEAGVSAHLEYHYGIVTNRLKRFDTEKDDTFLVETPNDDRFLVKIDSPYEEEGLAGFLAYVIETVSQRDPEIPIQRMRRAIDGSPVTWIEVDEHTRPFRVLTFLDGVVIGNVRPSKEVLSALGEMQARIQLALKEASHPLENRHGRLMWEMKALPRMASILPLLQDPELRERIHAYMAHFDEHVLPKLKTMPAQIVHNDFNLSNILLSEDRLRVAGILDFGDATRTEVISDIAVTLSSFFLLDEGDGFAATMEFLEGYLRLQMISDEEFSILGELIITRSVITVLVATWTSRLHPQNHDYLARFLDQAIPTCHQVLSIGPTTISDTIRDSLSETL